MAELINNQNGTKFVQYATLDNARLAGSQARARRGARGDRAHRHRGRAGRYHCSDGLMVLHDGTRLVSDCERDTLLLLTRAGRLTLFAGGEGEAGFVDGKGTSARLRRPAGMAVSKAGDVVLDSAGGFVQLRALSKAGELPPSRSMGGGLRRRAGRGRALQVSLRRSAGGHAYPCYT